MHLQRRPARRAARRPDVALLQVAPFDAYPVAAVRPLAGHADRLRVPEGTALARADRRADEFVVVLAGEVVAHDGDSGSDGGTPAGRFGPGTQIGGPELLDGTRHRRTLAAGPDLEVLVVYGPAFRWAAHTLPGFTAAVLAGAT